MTVQSIEEALGGRKLDFLVIRTADGLSIEVWPPTRQSRGKWRAACWTSNDVYPGKGSTPEVAIENAVRDATQKEADAT